MPSSATRLISAPAQKAAALVLRITTQPMASSFAKASSARAIPVTMAELRALSTRGRSSVMTPQCPIFSQPISASLIGFGLPASRSSRQSSVRRGRFRQLAIYLRRRAKNEGLVARRTMIKPEKLELRLRLRRNRKAEWTRRLVREHELSTADLIWPIFLIEGTGRQPIDSMPGVERLSIDAAAHAASEAAELGIPAIALFPYTDPSLRDAEASEALNEA